MSQKYTIELERLDVLSITLEITAEHFAQAVDRAREAAAMPDIWEVARGPVRILKVTAEAGT